MELVKACEQAIPALERDATAPAGPDGVTKVIASRFPLFPQSKRTEQEWDAWWADYFRTLADVPMAALENAMRAYIDGDMGSYMPKPGKLKALAMSTPCQAVMRLHRAKRAVEMAKAKPPVERVSPQTVQEILADFKAKAIPPKAPRPIHNTAGKPDAGGLTPEMREVLARRQGGVS